MIECPEPLTPVDCDLQGLKFMPVDLARMLDSDIFALSTGDEFKAAFALWGKSWAQVPAASLPDDERILAKFAAVSLSEWRTLAAMALRGWTKCSDGRLYHAVVAEKALEAWSERLAFQKRSAAGNAARHKHDFDPAPFDARIEEAKALLARLKVKNPQGAETAPTRKDEFSHKEAPRSGKGSEGTGTGTGNLESVPDGTAPVDAAEVDDELVLAEFRALGPAKGGWRLALKVLTERGGLTEAKARPFIGRLKALPLSDEELWRIAEATWRVGTQDPNAYLAKAAQEVVARRTSGGTIAAPAERQQRTWMADWRESAASWSGQRGPRPGEEGCRVAPEILREFGVTPFGEAQVHQFPSERASA